jgi:NAD(P)-dependent dehydrogenase (short-subunit alcohol dehydrogenase family)
MILKDRIAIVTAGGSGIGLAGAKAMAREGAFVVVADISPERSEEAAARIREAGGQAEARATDVSDDTALSALIDSVAETHGRLDILHSHAGIQVEGGIEELDVDGLDRSHRINVRSHYQAVKSAVPHMKKQGGGVVLITASNAGVFPDYGMVGYITTKAAAVMLAEQLALDLAKHNIRVNSLCPGWIDTPFNDPYTAQLGGREALEKVVRGRVPLGRFGTVDEIAESILFLVSDRSAYITGHALVIDGGEKLAGAGPASD